MSVIDPACSRMKEKKRRRRRRRKRSGRKGGGGRGKDEDEVEEKREVKREEFNQVRWREGLDGRLEISRFGIS